MDMSRKKSRGRMANGEPNPIDVYVGKRMRLRRQMLDLSQEKLASALGLTFQQVQKYERGLNRIHSQSPRHLSGEDLSLGRETSDPLFRMENIELITALSKIKNPKTINAIRELIISLSGLI